MNPRPQEAVVSSFLSLAVWLVRRFLLCSSPPPPPPPTPAPSLFPRHQPFPILRLAPQQYAICTSGTNTLRQVYALPHWDRSCSSNLPFHSQHTDTCPTSPRGDPITPGVWQGSHLGSKFEVPGVTPTGKAVFEPRASCCPGGRVTTAPGHSRRSRRSSYVLNSCLLPTPGVLASGMPLDFCENN